MNKENLVALGSALLLLNSIASAQDFQQNYPSTVVVNSGIENLGNLFTIRPQEEFYQGRFSNAQYVKLNKNVFNHLKSNNDQTIIINLPYNGEMLSFQIKAHDIFASNFQAFEKHSNGSLHKFDFKKGTFFRGTATQKELIALSLHKDYLGGIFSIPGKGNFNIVLDRNNPGIENDNYIIFNEADIITDEVRPVCAYDDNFQNPYSATKKADLIATVNCKAVDVALYADYLSYQKNNNNVQQTMDYLTTIFNGNAILFLNEGINITISTMVVNSQPDNYPTSSSNAILNKFGLEIGVNTTGDLMQFVSGYTQQGNYAPHGGLAWLDALCEVPFSINNNETYFGPFSMINTAALNNIPNIPIYSWDMNASNHEMGHNLGSPHTQSCSWNGNNTAIDGCVSAEGNCANGPIPGRGQGTMMSYCHLNNAVGVDFNNGYGPQPGNLIRSRYAGARCLSTSIIPQEIVATNGYTATADRVCEDNGWYYFYNTKNDNNAANDELLLMIEKSNSISGMNAAQITAKITTNQSWGTGVGTNIGNTSYSYYNDQKSMNKDFIVTFPSTPNGPVKVRFPFNQDDFNDLRNGFNVNTPEPFKAVIYTSGSVYNNPTNADTNSVKYLNHTLATQTPNSWSMIYTNPRYYIAEMRTNNNIYAGTLVYGDQPKYNLSVQNLDAFNISVYPNPATEFLNIENPMQKKLTIQLYNAIGQLVYETVTNGDVKLDVSNYANGIYNLQINVDGNIFNKKIVK